MAYYPHGKRFQLCTNCLCTAHQKTDTCRQCHKKTIRIFDSQSEANRFIYLKDRVVNLECQFKFPIYTVQFKFNAGSLSNLLPKIYEPSKNHKHVFDYKIDFAYIDPKNPLGVTFDEYKPSMKDKKTGIYKPIIREDARLKLIILATQLGDRYTVGVSYPDPQTVEGYSFKLFKPVEK